MLDFIHGLGGIVAAGLVLYAAQYVAQRQPWFTMRTRRLSIGTAIISFALGLTLASGAVAVWLYPKYERVIGVQRYGNRTNAKIVGYYKENCRNGCRYGVVYRYLIKKPDGRSLVVVDRGHFSDEPPAQVEMVPIVYDTRNPTASLINIRDQVFWSGPMHFIGVEVIVGFFSAIAGGFVAAGLASVSVLQKTVYD